ncbi:hypothetical protein SAMN06297387_12847 [Streptomyces zhaozhouensis]|uniref:Uncharacterized protein n=1 Tax=Streptomyces zhaozhouensis TaxID=1300267 RepID=A0A286E811_9ACTN|nr:hypothetical protein [Streptomyces zhaozhouensis]SOD67055.1 hypothetical protein SAMN06297387_12847 [Streptomyces zhaozhouensis]
MSEMTTTPPAPGVANDWDWDAEDEFEAPGDARAGWLPVVMTRATRAALEARIAGLTVALEAAVREQEELAARLRRADYDRRRAEKEASELEDQLAELNREADEMRLVADRPLLDHEDQVALRALLRQARRQARDPGVWVLLERGELHSVHSTREDAEDAAEALGAPRDGWTWQTSPAEDVRRTATEVLWRIQRMPLGGAQ